MLALFTFNNTLPWLNERDGSVVYLLDEGGFNLKIKAYKNDYELFEGTIGGRYLIKLEEV